MASPLAVEKTGRLPWYLRPVCTLAQPTASTFSNTNAVREYDSDDRDLDIDRRSDRRVFSPFGGAALCDGRTVTRLVRETEDGVHLRVDMPGLSKEDVKVLVEQNTLIIKGEGKKEFEEDETSRRYASRIDLPEKLYKANEIKAEMKNGVLKVFVPKIKEGERTDVYTVNVE